MNKINKKDEIHQEKEEINTDWKSPLESFYITSNYGWRIHPIHKTKKFHDGIDLRAKLNTPVYAVADGKIEFAGLNGTLDSGYGKYIRIDHGNGLKSFYAHLNNYNVFQGQEVKKGQQIGISGNTGGSQAPHLHFGVKNYGKSDNPLKYLPKIN